MKKDHRSGGKYSGSHTTVVPAAGFLVDVAYTQQEVTKLSLGFIKGGLPSIEGKRRAKITVRPGNLLVVVRDNTSHQEVTVYTNDPLKTRRALYRDGLKHGIEVSFVD
jgi:hypothetical protein